MLATFVAAQKTPIEAFDAIAGFRQACLRLWSTGRPETIATLMAQSALETGRWTSMFNYNPSNVKAGANYRGLYTCFPLINEVELRDGVRRTIWYSDRAELVSKNGPPAPHKPVYDVPEGQPMSRFRAFPSFTDGVVDKLAFLARDNYKAAREAAFSGDPGAYVRACKAAGYFTADLAPYERAVASLFATYLPLARNETLEPVELPAPEEDQLCQDMAECMRVEIPEWLRARVEAFQIPYQDLVDFTDRT